jgi:KaiC/GvpD/RAD55 family RecA-like ATPase
MYEFDDLPLSAVDPGTNLLVAGPAMGGTRELFLRMVVPVPGEEGVILVSTKRDAGSLVEELGETANELDSRAVGVVDAAGGQGVDDGGLIRTVSGPSDLTGIGMELTDLYEGFVNQGARQVRVGIDSISTLLMYTDVQTVFRFMHVTTGRVSSADGLGVYVIDPSSHDDQTVQTLNQLFDGRVDVQEGDDGPEMRVRGLSDQPREWQTF